MLPFHLRVFGLSGVLLTALLSGCAVNSTDDYNLCALSYGVAGLGIGLASGGTGAVVVGTAGGGGMGYLLCQEQVSSATDNTATQELASMIVEPQAPGDSDGDGVTDDRDACNNTPEGVAVNYQGCAKPLVFSDATLGFKFDSVALGPNADSLLQAAMVFVAKYPNSRFEIIGHTDDKGSDAYNNMLSLRRAKAVEARLLALGVPAASLQVSGRGEAQPVASNATESGRARNRRVEIRLVK